MFAGPPRARAEGIGGAGLWGRGAGGRGPYFDASAMTFAWPAL